VADLSDPLRRLREIVSRLRGPGGCPWDREQTHESLRTHLIEEAYEVVESIERGDHTHLREELGDLLLQIFLHSEIAAETGRFTVDDVARGISEKLVRRHPHVFGDVELATSDAVLKQWDQIKREEKGGSGSVLEDISHALPSLMFAEKAQKRVARVGFDWNDLAGVIEKLDEELREIKAVAASGEKPRLECEIGDLIFSAVNLARKAGLDAELVLRKATKRFIDRFQQLEKIAAERGQNLADLNQEQMDVIWEEVKKGERGD
jgi:MazG family protein